MSRAAWGEAQRYFREVVLTYEGDDCLSWPFDRDRQGYVVNRRVREAVRLRDRAERSGRFGCAARDGGRREQGNHHQSLATQGLKGGRTPNANYHFFNSERRLSGDPTSLRPAVAQSRAGKPNEAHMVTGIIIGVLATLALIFVCWAFSEPMGRDRRYGD